MTFKTGQLYMTKGIKTLFNESKDFRRFILECLDKYMRHDWGDLSDVDKEMNDSAIQNNDDRIFAHYNNTMGDIYIITEEDRSVTTILFTSEY